MGAPPDLPLSIDRKKQVQWFEEEVQPHEPSLRSYLRSLFPSVLDLDDLVQETYLRLIRAKESGRINYAKAFLFTTARNAALDIFRRRKVVSFEPVDDITEGFLADDTPDASEALNRQQELGILAEAIQTLPTRCRQTLTLRLLYGLPAKEIATRLGISEFTAKAQLAKGMRRCAAYFEERGLKSPAGGSQ
ncbi:RNA polymerase sigma factor [Oleiharenicola lentus]|uniref:RNA polymerase sigma factor n=1 Tax=Oleiharenicola lentus TaxID=2508720 RepID=UPI003F663D20